MPTKADAYVKSFLETGWLLALITTPLYFNVYSHRVFEPDKLAILRSIASLMLAGLVAMLLEQSPPDGAGASRWRAALARAWCFPLVRPTALLLLAYALATALSVAPRVSLWGSYQRGQGTYTWIAYLVVMGSLLLCLRTREQLARLCTAVILPSLPVALYGLIQHNGLDPLPWGGDVTQRVASTMGNAIFVSAYLIMVIPLTLARLVDAAGRALVGLPLSTKRLLAGSFAALWCVQVWAWFSLPFVLALWLCALCVGLTMVLSPLLRQPLAPLALVGCHSLILSSQITAVFFSGSRGPQVGLVGGLLLMALLYAAARRRRRLLVAMVSLGLLLAGMLVAINLPRSPLAWVREMPYIGRLGRILELGEGTGRVRVLIWQGAVEMLADDPWRAIVGHGPETMYVSYTPYYPAELAQIEARNATPDRSHNETFDALITTGVLGLAASLALLVILFRHGFAWLGLVPQRRGQMLLALCTAGGGLLGVAAPWAIEGTLRLSGVGLPLGVMAGLAVYVVAQALLWSDQQPALEGWPQLLLIALLAALAAHWIEISVGIAIAVTRTYFWAFAAVAVLLGMRLAPADDAMAARTVGAILQERHPAREAARRRTRQRPRARRARTPQVMARRPLNGELVQLITNALMLGLMLCILVWDLTMNPSGLRSPVSILWDALARPVRPTTPSILGMGTLGLFVATAGIGVLLAVAEQRAAGASEDSSRSWPRSLGLCAAIACGLWLLYGLAHAGRLAPPVDTLALLGLFYALLVVVAAGMATILYLGAQRGPQLVRGSLTLAALPLALVLVLLALQRNVTPVRADMVYKQGLRYDDARRWELAAELYEQAAAMAPQEDYYWLFAGRARLEHARTLPDAAQRDAAFAVTIDRLETARALAPLNPDHSANLARTYRAWAELTQEPQLRAERLATAQRYYEEAIARSPQNAQLLNELAQVHIQQGDYASAQGLLERSLSLDDQFANTYIVLGDLYATLDQWDAAIVRYRQGLELAPGLLYGWSRLAYAHAQREEWDQAIAANLRLLEAAPNDYTTLRNLALLYDRAGQPAEALRYLERALAVAPATDVEGLRQLGQRLAQDLAAQAP